MIGTTHFTNAVVEARRLAPTGAIRLGLPATDALPPMVDWPAALREALGGHVAPLPRRPRVRRPPRSRRSTATSCAGPPPTSRAKGIRAVAISSVFSPVNAEAELEARGRDRARSCPGAAISLSHEIGRIGLLERENATIMNACLRELAAPIVAGLPAGARASSGSTRRSTSARTTAR